MRIRNLEKKDMAAAKALWGYAFENQEPFYSWYFDEVLSADNLLGVFFEDRLAGSLQLNPYRLSLNGSNFDASYIVGVITDPAYRNKGLTTGLMIGALEEMNRRKHAVSILMPFDTAFYSNYGWELCYSQSRYEVPIEMLKNFGHKEGNFLPIVVDDNRSLQGIYEAYLKDCHGYIQRSPRDWKVMLQDLHHDGGYGYLLTDALESPVGYILYFIKDNRLCVREIAYSTHWAKKSLMGFIYGHKSQVTTAEWPAPLCNQDFLFLRDTIKPTHTNSIRILPFMAGRVINVKTALEGCRYDKNINSSYAIQIADVYAPWNNGVFSVLIKDGVVFVDKVEEIQPDLSCSINTFSRLFFGAISLEQAIFMDEITIHNPTISKTLSSIFQKKNNFINEYF